MSQTLGQSKDKERTRVYLTVDVECAEERVTRRGVVPALGHDLRVFGRFSNQSQELGIAFMLEELRRNGLRGTFFVEVLASKFFGMSGLAETCQRLQTAGQDVQLHLHPNLAHPAWHSEGKPPIPDDLATYDLATQIAFLTEGVAILEKAGVRREHVTVFRAGNYGGNNDTWRALEAVGIPVSSTYNLSYLGRGCAFTWPREETSLFRATPAVWEVPVAVFREPGRGARGVQFEAVSFAEMRHLLEEAPRLGVGHVVIVSHPFEHFFIDSADARTGRPNRIVRERWSALARYLRDHADRYQVEPLAELAGRLRAGTEPSWAEGVAPAFGDPLLRVRRLGEQAYKRVAARLRVPM